MPNVKPYGTTIITYFPSRYPAVLARISIALKYSGPERRWYVTPKGIPTVCLGRRFVSRQLLEQILSTLEIGSISMSQKFVAMVQTKLPKPSGVVGRMTGKLEQDFAFDHLANMFTKVLGHDPLFADSTSHFHPPSVESRCSPMKRV